MTIEYVLTPRDLRAEDRDAVVAIDQRQTGEAKPEYWSRVLARFLDEERAQTFGVGVDGELGELRGFLFGEVRAFEFGSRACGWIFAVGVDEAWRRRGMAGVLLEGALKRFRALGVTKVRTMVRRNDVPVLSFFRASRFVGGPYVQLEREIGLLDETGA